MSYRHCLEPNFIKLAESPYMTARTLLPYEIPTILLYSGSELEV